MNEERGAALRLLYQMKLAIQKDKPHLFGGPSSPMKTMTNLEPSKVDMKLSEVQTLKQTLPGLGGLMTINRSKKL